MITLIPLRFWAALAAILLALFVWGKMGFLIAVVLLALVSA